MSVVSNMTAADIAYLRSIASARGRALPCRGSDLRRSADKLLGLGYLRLRGTTLFATSEGRAI
jgi:hypothetical protein